ncbi:hypothetical protein E2C01_068368 [Portunus trituberculatus]|uniref:Uncharacterized protein n=1 Tax=Portunus trituberculatus TaxID=210409 RepID=A0A5B7HVL4_PORTR|nr:hypothetical protein [Portunus trituberculatus]
MAWLPLTSCLHAPQHSTHAHAASCTLPACPCIGKWTDAPLIASRHVPWVLTSSPSRRASSWHGMEATEACWRRRVMIGEACPREVLALLVWAGEGVGVGGP